MINSFLEARPVITVAVKFDQHAVPLTRSAIELCQRTGKRLNLLHVVEPWLDHSHSKPFENSSPLWDAMQAVEMSARDLAGRNLDELARMAPETMSVAKSVVVGKPAETIGAEAARASSALLVVGGAADAKRNLFSGLSTAVSLMVTAPLPVLVIDTRLTPGLPRSGIRMLVADDLSRESEAAVCFAFDMACAYERATLHHVHVNSLTRESLRSGLEVAEAASRTLGTPTRSTDDVYRALNANLKDQLAGRAANYRDYLEEAGGTYVSAVEVGGVQKELATYVERAEPDILVFGRHKTVHTRPFFLGRLPFGAMLSHRRPIIVVPNE